MKFTLVLPALFALVSAMPAAPATLDIRVAPCADLPLGDADKPPSDTVDAFHAFAEYANVAKAAATKVPTGFKLAFFDQQATTYAPGYQTYIALSKTYDVDACAAKCKSINGCKGFNIYFERDPSQVSVFARIFAFYFFAPSFSPARLHP